MIADSIRPVIGRRRYMALFSAAAALALLMLYFLTVATTAGYDLGIFIMMNGLSYTMFTLFTSAVASLLFGLYASMAAYRLAHNSRNAKPGIAGAAGSHRFSLCQET